VLTKLLEWALSHFVEFQNFGLNAITASFCMTTFFALWGFWGLTKQIKKVKAEGAETLSVMWTLTFFAMFATCLPYGIVNGKFALVVTFLCRIPLYVILVPAIYKAREGFSRNEWLWAGVVTIIFSGALVSVNITFLILAWVGAVMAADQPRKILKNKNTIGVSIELVIAYLASTSFWFLYGLSTSDTYIMVWGGTYALVYGTTTVLYYHYRGK